MFDFNFLSQYKEYVDNLQNASLVLFGAGDNCSNIMNWVFKYGEVAEIWDNSPAKKDCTILGYKVISPAETKFKPGEAVVIITPSDEITISSITNQLHEMGYKCYPSAVLTLMNQIERYNSDYSKKFHEMNSYPLIEANKDKIAEVRSLLADEKSRFVYDKIVEKTKYNIDDHIDICDDIYDHYFSDGIFEYGDNEVFVDGGAFVGEDTIRLYHKIGDKLKRSYCFEPDTANAVKATKNLRKLFGNDEKFRIMPQGLFDKNTDLGFTSYGTHSSVFSYLRNITDGDSVPAVRLDDVDTGDDKITLIKMDIEGAEIPALRGAENIIRRDKPKLAICIYHMIEDLWQIPLLIHELNPEYKLYIRHHTTKFWDSVIYAM
jgi:FkbM family methyltransferase